MKRSLSIPTWHHLAQEGKAPPVRIQLNGYSMNPLIRGYRDYVTVIPIQDQLQNGDIVMFCEPGTERYVIHRIWDQNAEKILTWGDNCLYPDGWLSADAILGKISLIERGKRRIQPNPRKGIIWAGFWHRVGKAYRLYRRYKAGIIRRIRKLKKSEDFR